MTGALAGLPLPAPLPDRRSAEDRIPDAINDFMAPRTRYSDDEFTAFLPGWIRENVA